MKEDFKKLLKGGSESVWQYIERAEEILFNLQDANEWDREVIKLTKKVREDKRFDFEQYKVVRRFLSEHERLAKLKPQLNDDYIILE